MIVDFEGRRRSSKSVHDELGDLEELISKLTPAEYAAFMMLLEDMEDGGGELLDDMHGLHYDEPPVSCKQFLSDPYYVGVAGKELWPKLRDDLIEICEGSYIEAVATGSIGFGKSTLAEFALLWQLYETLMLTDPQATYGLMPGSDLVFAIVSVNLKQARRGMFHGMIEKMARSEFFQSVCPPQIKESEGEMIFPKNVRVVCGSPGSEQLIGLNVFGGVIDETNFMDRTHSSAVKAAHARQDFAENANALYRSIIRRMKSRFMRVGRTPGTLLLVSSKGTVGAFTEQRIKAAKSNPQIFVREYATWDVMPESNFDGKKFPVLVGDELAMSRILDPKELPRVKAEIAGVDRSARIIWVPVEYRDDFEGDLEKAIRDVAGVATQGIRPFITRRSKIDKALDRDRRHPFTVDVWVAGEKGTFNWGALCRQIEVPVRGGFKERKFQPLMYPGAPRHVHIDTSLGKQDALGFAMGCISRWRDVVRKASDGKQFVELAPDVWLDCYLRILAPPGGEIILGDIRTLVYSLQQHGFSIGLVTTDKFQYADTHQQFKQRGIPAELLSLDTSTRGYDHLKDALYEDRLFGYAYPELRQELMDLEYNPKTGKVDHPAVGSDGKPGSKDVADAVAGVVCSLVEKAPGRPLGIGVMTSAVQDEESYDESWVLGRRGKRAKIVSPDGDAGMLPVPMLIGDYNDGD